MNLLKTQLKNKHRFDFSKSQKVFLKNLEEYTLFNFIVSDFDHLMECCEKWPQFLPKVIQKLSKDSLLDYEYSKIENLEMNRWLKMLEALLENKCFPEIQKWIHEKWAGFFVDTERSDFLNQISEFIFKKSDINNLPTHLQILKNIIDKKYSFYHREFLQKILEEIPFFCEEVINCSVDSSQKWKKEWDEFFTTFKPSILVSVWAYKMEIKPTQQDSVWGKYLLHEFLESAMQKAGVKINLMPTIRLEHGELPKGEGIIDLDERIRHLPYFQNVLDNKELLEKAILDLNTPASMGIPHQPKKRI